jgi:hypothetical protein
MYSDALFSASRFGDQVAYATQHFQDLQGLRYVPLWAAWLLLSAFSESTRLPQRDFVEINILILVVFCAAWLPWIGRWYRLRYGIVMAAPSRSGARKLAVFTWFLLTLAATLLFPKLDVYRSCLHLWPVFFFVLPSGLHLPPANLPIRLRFVLYVVAILSLLALIGCAPVLHLSVEAVQGGFCAALLAISLYDHWLLKHLLNGAHRSSYD